MPQVYNLHNVVTPYDERLHTHRNCIDYESFDRFLGANRDRFCRLQTVVRASNGEALTIDDATSGAYDAAMLCEVNKVYVTLFVNPYYIANRQNYYMHYLSCLLDLVSDEHFRYHAYNVDMKNRKHVKMLRNAIKQELLGIAHENDRLKKLEELFGRKVADVKLPDHLRTMSFEQLQLLNRFKYVDIEYHGWTHTSTLAMSVEDIQTEYQLAKSWFASHLQKDISFFALPFGTRDVRLETLDHLPIILLEDPDYACDLFTPQLINRIPLKFAK